jgi:hypothetical protein
MRNFFKRNKTTLFFGFLAGLFILFLPFMVPEIFSPSLAVAQTHITIATSVPGSTGSVAGPGAFVANFYWFALIIGGVLAFGVVVYGGIRYMTSAGNPSGQSDAKEWIEAALLGLLMLVCVYFILDVINPQLLNLNLPVLTAVNISNPSGGGTSGGGTGNPVPPNQACQTLTNDGVTVSCSQLAGVQSATVDALADLKKECPGDAVSVSSVTGGSHSTQGGCTHANGYKADVRPNDALSSCIEGFTPDGTRSDGATLYKAADGAVFANETQRPSNCGSNCNWTGGHWDIQACGVN